MQKQHTISRGKICKAKRSGGLGIPELAESNQIMLTKFLWRLVKHPSELSSCILTTKYGGWRSLLLGSHTLGASHIWRALVGVFPLAYASIRWVLGNGRHINFWYDRWFGVQSFASLFGVVIPDALKHATPSSFWDPVHGWNTPVLANYLSAELLAQLTCMAPTLPPEDLDAPI